MNEIVKRVELLREQMKHHQVDAYIVPTSDFHETEYVCDYFKARAYMSGFRGSAGTCVFTADEGKLWTDGRYFIQAAKQLEGSDIDLMRMGDEGVPTIEEYLLDVMPEGAVLGFDGRVLNTAMVENLQKKLKAKNIAIECDMDLVGEIWEDRPALPASKTFALDVKYTGKNAGEKLAAVREKMKEAGADTHIITRVDDIAWLFNMRGDDIPCFPVVLCYAMIRENDAYLYMNKERLSDDLKQIFEENNVSVKAYDAIYEDVKHIAADAKVLLDKANTNFKIVSSLPQGTQVINQPNPVVLMKAMKNPVELENIRRCHIRDAVAMTKFMYWLKNNVGKTKITEISASDQLLKLRSEQEYFMEPSFNTIAAYNDHAAMMHYSATEETDVELKPEGLLLVDSGGQYLEGTTDITRTFVLGPISEECRFHFTTALRSMIALAKARFLYGCRGMNLDILARGPLWDLDLDYKCGTGHGIGHVLNVHESPNGFRWRVVPERNDSCVLEEGMVQSDEPGVYLEGKYGIRHENETVVRKGEKNEYGQFMYLETITFVPFDLDGIDPDVMTKYEREWLNAYHREVYAKVSPYLNKEENEWLKQATRAI